MDAQSPVKEWRGVHRPSLFLTTAFQEMSVACAAVRSPLALSPLIALPLHHLLGPPTEAQEGAPMSPIVEFRMPSSQAMVWNALEWRGSSQEDRAKSHPHA